MRARETGTVLLACVAALWLAGCASAGDSDPCAPMALVGDRCVDLQRDPANCGAAGRVCPTGDLCRGGACATVFATEWVTPPGSTVPTITGEQCGEWYAFLLRPSGTYSKITISGSRNPAGITCDDPVTVGSLVTAFKDLQPVSYTCGGSPWRVCSCGGTVGAQAPEISAGAGVTSCCSCLNGPDVAIVRPCAFLPGFNFGGINGPTCLPTVAQSMTVAFIR